MGDKNLQHNCPENRAFKGIPGAAAGTARRGSYSRISSSIPAMREVT
jgi:hypothetical protein